MSAKRKNLNLLEKLRLIKESKTKSQRNLASQFGISVGAVNNILKRKREYENLGEVLICVQCCNSGICVHEHISPLLGEHPRIVNIFLGPVSVHYREVSLYNKITSLKILIYTF